VLLDITVTPDLCWNYFETVMGICWFSGVGML